MAALIGLEPDVAAAVANEAAGDGVCTAANDNAPGQVVISGDTAAVERTLQIAVDNGAKRSIMLQVSAPFHCALMAPAAEVMAEALEAVNMSPLAVPLVANVTAGVVTDASEIRQLLVEQVTGMVRWRECGLTLKDQGVDSLVEVGAGKVLSGLARRIDRDLAAVQAGSPETIEAFLESL